MPDSTWGSLPGEIAADVRRVADRLRTLSPARLAAPPAPPPLHFPAYESCAQAGRAAANALARAAQTLEAAAEGQPRRLRDLPTLSPFAVGDQVAVAGHDLLAAVALVGPDTRVWTDTYANPTAAHAVTDAARLLADVRRRI